jgi:hypothetical protein
VKKWTRILPLCFVAWFARRRLMRIPVNGVAYVQPYKDVLIRADERGEGPDAPARVPTPIAIIGFLARLWLGIVGLAFLGLIGHAVAANFSTRISVLIAGAFALTMASIVGLIVEREGRP